MNQESRIRIPKPISPLVRGEKQEGGVGTAQHQTPSPNLPLSRGRNIALIFIILTSITLNHSSSAGLSVTPSRIQATLTVNEPHSFMLIVENPTSEVALIEAYPDNFADIVTAEPTSFMLESGQEHKIRVTVTPKTTSSFSTLLSIVSRPLGDRSFNAGAGIKIPLQFEAVEGHEDWPRWMIGIAVADALLLLVLIRLIAPRLIRRRIHKQKGSMTPF